MDMSVEEISGLNVAELILLKSQTWQLNNHGQLPYKEKEWHYIYEAQCQASPAHTPGSSGAKTQGVYVQHSQIVFCTIYINLLKT